MRLNSRSTPIADAAAPAARHPDPASQQWPHTESKEHSPPVRSVGAFEERIAMSKTVDRLLCPGSGWRPPSVLDPMRSAGVDAQPRRAPSGAAYGTLRSDHPAGDHGRLDNNDDRLWPGAHVFDHRLAMTPPKGG